MENKELKKESERLELKKSVSELKEGIISIVSILNKHRQGELYFGIKNNGELVGQIVSEKTLREISKAISDFIEPKIFPIVEHVKIENKDIVHVKFNGDNIPYYAYGRAYIRVCDENKQMSAREIERIILEKNKDALRWDNKESDKQIKDINIGALKEFIKKANEAKRINFKFSDPRTSLNKLGLIKGDKLTRAAEALFCDKNSIEVQAAVFAGTDKVTFLDIRKFNGNIFSLIEQSENYLKEHMNWRAKMEDLERVEIPEVPLRALTEAIVNSLCHRDFANPKGNEIAVFKDRIEIYNPGNFPEGLTPEDFIKKEERSILRNPLIAETLYLSRTIEKWGSGIKRIYNECKEAGVKVEFKMIKSGFLVVFYRREEIEGEKAGEEGRLVEGLVEGLVESQKKILKLVKENSHISKAELSAKIGISTTAIDKNIEKLKQKGLIKRIGPDKGGYWEIQKEDG